MNCRNLVSKGALCTALLLLSNAAFSVSPCPPNPAPPLLSLERPDWVIALVTVVEQPEELPAGATRVSVDRVFSGTVESELLTVFPNLGFFDCGAISIPASNIGSSWLIGTEGPNADGSYSGPYALTVFSIHDGSIVGAIPDFQESSDSKTLDEFAAFVNSRTARAETDDYILSMEPQLPGPSDPVTLQIEGKFGLGCLTSTNAVSVDRANASILLSFASPPADFTPCPPLPDFSIELPVLGSPSGQDHYLVEVFFENITGGESPFRNENLIAEFDYTMRTDSPQLANPEVPAEGSIQSGIGVIRGWACEAQRIEVQLNERPRIQLAHGTLRTDTREVCGDSANGYGAVYAWGLLGPGQHTMRTYIDDQLVETVNFEVAGLEDEFATDLEATYELTDFPEPGQSTTVRWSEAAQNFIIVGTAP